MGRLLPLLCCLHAGSVCGRGNASGDQLVVDKDGAATAYNVVPLGRHFAIVDEGRGLRLPRTNRKYIAAGEGPDRPWFGIPSWSFANFSLPGRVLSVKIDLGGRPMSGCMASMYSVSDPGPCGVSSKCVNDTWHGGLQADNPVPQLDLFMVNSHESIHQSHACRGPWSVDNCDVNGTVGYRFDALHNEFGPGPQFTINTLEPFHIHIAFHSSRRIIQTVYRQEGRQIQRASSEYAKDIWQDLAQGQTLALSYWSDPLLKRERARFFQCPYEVTFSNFDLQPIWRPRPKKPTKLSTTVCIALVEIILLFVMCGLIYGWRRRARSPLCGSALVLEPISPRLPAPRQPVSELPLGLA